jgi:hypothetical protein
VLNSVVETLTLIIVRPCYALFRETSPGRAGARSATNARPRRNVIDKVIGALADAVSDIPPGSVIGIS